MKRLWSDLRILVEPAGAAAVAAYMSGRAPVRQNVALLVCGANLDPELAASAMAP